jgi:hypothetical protein
VPSSIEFSVIVAASDTLPVPSNETAAAVTKEPMMSKSLAF